MSEEKIKHLPVISTVPKDVSTLVQAAESMEEAIQVLKDAIVEEAVQIKCGFKQTLSDMTNIMAAYIEYEKAAGKKKGVSEEDF